MNGEHIVNPRYLIDYDAGVLDVAAARCNWYLSLIEMVERCDAVGVVAFQCDGTSRLYGSTNSALWDSTDHAYSIKLVLDQGFLGVPEGSPV